MSHLADRAHQSHLAFVDLHSDAFLAHPDIDFGEANRVLHGKTANGEILFGLDVTHAAWHLVGRGWLIAPLRWPIIRWFADKCYLSFARNRFQWSRWLTGQSRCDGHCTAPALTQQKSNQK
jgi:predicted DCC family thiol-disulfide oxidoreductase YuxK